MTTRILFFSARTFAALAVIASSLSLTATGQTASRVLPASKDEKVEASRPRANNAAPADTDDYFKDIYRQFYETYRLGPDDEIAIRIVGQPDYSIEKAQVSPFGRVYHPLLGEVEVVALTVGQLNDKLTTQFSEYIVNPRVSVSLLKANSAKIGVLGEVARPGILIMTRPMTVFDAISTSGGVTDFGNKSKVTVLRQVGEIHTRAVTVNVKRILEGKAGPEENVRLQAGDTVVVHGNFKKTLSTITQIAGFGYFVRTIADR